MKLRVSLSGAYQPLIDELMSRDSGHRGARMQQLAYQGLLLEQALTNGHAAFSFGTFNHPSTGSPSETQVDSGETSTKADESDSASATSREAGRSTPSAINVMDRQED